MPKYFFNNRGGGVIYDEEDMKGLGTLGAIVIGIALVFAIVMAIVSAISKYFIKLYDVIADISGPIYDFIIVKILLLPSTFDLFFNLLPERHFIKAFIFMGLIVGYFLILGLLPMIKKSKFISQYIFLNIGILGVRFLFVIAFGVASFFVSETEILEHGKVSTTDYIFAVHENSQGLNYKQYTYSNSDVENGITMPDANFENGYRDVFWVTFGEYLEEQGSHSSFSGSYSFDQFLFDSPEYINRFKTTISYAPITDNVEYTNQSPFTISLIGDNKVMETYTLTSENNVINIDIPVNVLESFEIKIEGDINDHSVVTLLGTEFIHNF